MTLKWVADHFGQLQYIFLGIVLFMAWTGLRSRQQQSSFKSREANRDDLGKLKASPNDLANAKMKKGTPERPLQLPGITLTGEPHEILGVDIRASETEIMRAYKEKMKQFHPDRIQGQARNQMKFYEEAAAKINQAKETLLANLKK